LADDTTGASGSLATALAHAERLLGPRPADAEAQAREILTAVPGHPQALYLQGAALRGQGKLEEARAILEPLAKSQPRAAVVHYELGLTLGALSSAKAAIASVARATSLNPRLDGAWRTLGDVLTLAGESEGADAAYARQIKESAKDPRLLAAATALCDNKLNAAELALREFLKEHPTDVAAIRMLAETGSRLGRLEEAEKLLHRCLELAPGFAAARHNYATVLYRQARAEATLAQLDELQKVDPKNPNYRMLRAAALVQTGDITLAADAYEGVLRTHPQQAKVWMSYGHVLKTLGRRDEGVAAYRKSIALLKNLGEAWWSLANLKTFAFSADEIAQMQTQLARVDISDEDRFHLHFALGKSFEDLGDYARSFAHYESGNTLRRKTVEYDADEVSEHMKRSRALFTPAFFAARQGWGDPAPDPIFIVGLPRAGSTLVEQILSSHSQVEGTMELPDIMSIARRLGGKKRRDQVAAYPDNLADLTVEEIKALGEEYLTRTRIQRKRGLPFFIDKMPNNFAHIGMIQLILPNARIIDARRHPLACCFSGFKQHFARGQNFTYALTDLGRYYADYVALMSHFDSVLPGRIHRVIYERMIDEPEAEIRSLLQYCGLAFEERCLRFYETERAVRTASSEQVRLPIFREGLEHWRNFEPWLGPLKQALGAVLDCYPDVPSQ
jgi:predicted Zn-dependent protease